MTKIGRAVESQCEFHPNTSFFEGATGWLKEHVWRRVDVAAIDPSGSSLWVTQESLTISQ